MPCPHLRIPVGNVYEQNLSDIWINSDLLIKLRDRNNLKGSCKSCEYRNICGGCRAAAYWITGDVFGEDPICFKDLL
ncbi:SPASM domain-containing protein [Thermococcus sp.]